MSSSTSSFDVLCRELSDLRLPHKLKQYREYRSRIASLIGQVDADKIDALNGQLDNAVLCGVECFLCGNDNATSFSTSRPFSSTSMRSRGAPTNSANNLINNNFTNKNDNPATNSVYGRSLSSTGVRHHPPVNASGYLYNSQTSWHGGSSGRASSTGSASPQPDSIDSDVGSVSLTTIASSDNDSVVDKAMGDIAEMTEKEDCQPEETLNNNENQKPEHAENESDSVAQKDNTNETNDVKDNQEGEEKQVKEEVKEVKEEVKEEQNSGEKTQEEKPKEEEKMRNESKMSSQIVEKTERPVTPSKSPIHMMSTNNNKTNSVSNMVNNINNHSNSNYSINSNGRASKSPGPPVSPKPARKTPTNTSFVIGASKGSYKAYKDFIANYSKTTKE